jgi:hypothetical protein
LARTAIDWLSALFILNSWYVRQFQYNKPRHNDLMIENFDMVI